MSKKKETAKKLPKRKWFKRRKGKDIGYPPYPDKEDIYNKGEKEDKLDPSNPADEKSAPSEEEKTDWNHKLKGKRMGGDLDVPGSAIDDRDERIGEEDEENNYYSLDSEQQEKDRDEEE